MKKAGFYIIKNKFFEDMDSILKENIELQGITWFW